VAKDKVGERRKRERGGIFLTMQNKTRIDVVCAVIVSEDVANKGRDDLYLIAKRAKEKTCPDLWEFVGGKVECEEKHSNAVKREVMEKLGVEIVITGFQEPIYHSYDHAKIRLLPYLCKLTNKSDEPEAFGIDHSELVWVECWDMWYV
jgi:8-oxo-dGTP diphosphatase